MRPASLRYRDLLARAAGALGVLVCVNFALQGWAVNTMPRQLLRHARLASSPTTLFLGNSTMAAALDETTFAEASPGSRPLNMALGATQPTEHYLLLRQRPLDRGATVVYGFIDTQMTDPVDGSWTALVGNRALAYYVEPDVAANLFAPESPKWRAGFLLVAHVPLLRERSVFWSRVEGARRFLAGVGLPRQATNRFGRAQDFALLEADPAEFVRRCAAAADRPFSRPVAEILQRAQTNGNPVYVLEMPMTSTHRARFFTSEAWQTYRVHVRALVQQSGARFLDASDWISDDLFADPLHVSEAGARAFSARLAGELR